MRTLYVHFPLCAMQCSYCAFPKATAPASPIARKAATARLAAYTVADIAYEARQARRRAQAANSSPPSPLASIFLGGGTPSLAGPRYVAAIIQTARQTMGIAPNAEVTLETNPSPAILAAYADPTIIPLSIDADASNQQVSRSQLVAGLTTLRDAGITRLSVGVQTLHARRLSRLLGRTDHTPTDALRVLDAACDVFGSDHVSADLLWAIPGQRWHHDWEDDLRKVMGLGIGHLSLYQLTIERGTPLARTVAGNGSHTGMISQYPISAASTAAHRKPQLLSQDAVEDMYLRTVEFVTNAGYTQYEPSSFARRGINDILCVGRHNVAYWLGAEYIGVGPGAHGRLRDGNDWLATVKHHAISSYSRDAELLMRLRRGDNVIGNTDDIDIDAIINDNDNVIDPEPPTDYGSAIGSRSRVWCGFERRLTSLDRSREVLATALRTCWGTPHGPKDFNEKCWPEDAFRLGSRNDDASMLFVPPWTASGLGDLVDLDAVMLLQDEQLLNTTRNDAGELSSLRLSTPNGLAVADGAVSRIMH